jgi:uncharacterized membrane protein YfcA
VTALILGVLVGFVMGLTGAGGGILAVPSLVFGLGWTLAQAAPVALLAAAVAGLVGALEGLKRGILRYRAAIVMAAVGVCVTPLGVRAAQALPQHALLYTFAAVLAWVAFTAFRDTREGVVQRNTAQASVPCKLDPRSGRLRWTLASTTILASIGAASGFLAGLLGVGGGFVIVPALRRASDLSIHSIVTTSLAVIALVASGAVIASLAHGASLPVAVAGPFVGGAVAGMLGGRVLIHRLPPRRVQQLFAAVTLLAAAGLAARAAGIFPGP